MEGPGVVDVDRLRRDHEILVLIPHEVPVCPHTQASVFGQAVAADARAGENHIAVGGPHPDGVDHLDEIDAVLFTEVAPLVHKGQDGGPEAVFNDFGGLAFDRPVQNRERKLLHVEHIGEKPLHSGFALRIDAAAYAPEVPDGLHVILAGHDPFIAVRKKRLTQDAARGEGLLHGGVCDVFGGSGRHRRLDEHQAVGPDLLADDPHGFLQSGDLRAAAAAVAQLLLEKVALDVHHHNIGKTQGIVGICRHEVLPLEDTAPDQRVDLRILGLHRRDPAVEHGDLPEAPGAGPLHADDILHGLAGLTVRAVGDYGGHDRPHKAQAHDDDDLPPEAALLFDRIPEPLEFLLVIGLLWERIGCPIGAVRICLIHGSSSF